jgi:poly(3-hydroxybutyrate) depolymerase
LRWPVRIAEKNRRHFTAEKCGHYGIVSGRRWRTIIYPQLREFIAEHDRAPGSVCKEDRRKEIDSMVG